MFFQKLDKRKLCMEWGGGGGIHLPFLVRLRVIMRGYQDQSGVCSKICEVAITRNSATSGKILPMDDKKTQPAD